MLDCPTFSAGLPERFPSACWTARVLAGGNARTIGQRTLEQTEGRLHRLILTTSHWSRHIRKFTCWTARLSLLDCPTVFGRYLRNPCSLDQLDCTVVIGRLGRTFMYGGFMYLRRLGKKLDFWAGAAGRNQGNLTVQVYPFFPQNLFGRYLKNGWCRSIPLHRRGRTTREQTEGRLGRSILTTSHWFGHIGKFTCWTARRFSAGLPECFPAACWSARVSAGRNARTIGHRTMEQTEGRLHRLILTTSHWSRHIRKFACWTARLFSAGLPDGFWAKSPKPVKSRSIRLHRRVRTARTHIYVWGVHGPQTHRKKVRFLSGRWRPDQGKLTVEVGPDSGRFSRRGFSGDIYKTGGVHQFYCTVVVGRLGRNRETLTSLDSDDQSLI